MRECKYECRRARYLAELIIRDYGTHVITKTELGARIEIQQWVKKTEKGKIEKDMSSWKVGAKVSAADVLGVGFSVEKVDSNERAKNFSRSVTNIDVNVFGVNPFKVKALMTSLYMDPDKYIPKVGGGSDNTIQVKKN